MTDDERQTRVQLAACYRLMAHYGVDDLTYNHLSARVPDAPDTMLLGLMRMGPKAVKCCFSRQQLLASDSCAHAMAVN